MYNLKILEIKYHSLSDETKKKLFDYYKRKWLQNNQKTIRLK